MHEPTAEKVKARRDLRILVVCMLVGMVLPAVMWYAVHLRN